VAYIGQQFAELFGKRSIQSIGRIIRAASMIGLLQRVTEARVSVGGVEIAAIGRGLLVLVGVERGDGAAQAKRLAERITGYRVFPDDAGKMNRSVVEIGGGVLLVPQFTLAADTDSGSRPSLSRGADPTTGACLFAEVVRECERFTAHVAAGRFGAEMQVGLVNDGPVTFWLHVPASR
jgi:D-tyrosyl-tRNA(Tyr) deacylase